MKAAVSSLFSIIFACAVFTAAVAADAQHRPSQRFNCTVAGKMLRQGDAAQTAGDDQRMVRYYQQAIEAYELCDNATPDDRDNEVAAIRLRDQRARVFLSRI